MRYETRNSVKHLSVELLELDKVAYRSERSGIDSSNADVAIKLQLLVFGDRLG